MSANSKIEWTDHTFNPWEGCQKVGPGCDHCYAETRNARFGGGVAVKARVGGFHSLATCAGTTALLGPALPHGVPTASVPEPGRPHDPVRPLRRTPESPHVANIKSQIKRIRTNEKARMRNKAVKSELKTYVRRVREAVAGGDKEKAGEALVTASRKLDKAVSKGVIHANQAANKKSALAKSVNGL